MTRVVDLSIGEPGHEPPAGVRRAAASAALGDDRGYSPQGGNPHLREALVDKLIAQGRTVTGPAQVLVTTGATLGIFATLATVCEPGDAILLPDPGFPLYGLMARTQRLQTAFYRLREERGFEPDWDKLEKQARTARLLVWNFPHNPTGATAEAGWVERLVEIVSRNPRLYLLSDEVYEDYVYEGAHIGPGQVASRIGDRLISTFSFSKSFAIPGWRVGYLHAADELVERVARAHWAAAMSAPTTSQAAALAALLGSPETYRGQMLEALRESRELAVASVRKAGLQCGWPAGGMFVWADVTASGMQSTTFAARALTEAGVRLAPGLPFGSDRHVRISFGADAASLREGFARLSEWLAH